MSEVFTTHHKIKAEWTKASKNEIYENSSSKSDRLEIDESEIFAPTEAPQAKIEILEQIVIYPSHKSVKCHYCDKNFDKSALEEHQKTHDETFFNCTECDKKFRRKSSLRKHFNYLHKGKFKYECKECIPSVTFVDLTKFDLHRNTKHETSETRRAYQCKEANCLKSFASPEYLKRHQVTHNDEFKYKCTVCDQKFKWMTSLQVHQTIHTQNKTLVECKVCFKRFFNHRTMERHQKIHKNVKYKCTLCEKVVSNRKDNIRRHIRHLHGDIQKHEISAKIETIVGADDMQFEEDMDSLNVEITSNEAQSDDDDNDYSTVETIEAVQEAPAPQPVINNRVKVIQSIGNPNKHHQVIEATVEILNVEETSKPQPPPTEPDPPPLPIKPQETETEIKLPPKKKAIALSQPSSSTPAAKPKYDPIQHYRKILLGFSTPIEDATEEEDVGQETQVFPVHWRKRTSQNFLFRR